MNYTAIVQGICAYLNTYITSNGQCVNNLLFKPIIIINLRYYGFVITCIK